MDKSSGAADRSTAQFISQMDQLHLRQNLFFLATTNRYDRVDPAVSRQGRLGLHLEVAALNIDDKVDILRLALKKAYPESEAIVDELINIFREQFSSMTTAQIGDAVTRTVTEQAMEKLEQVSTDESDQDENAAQLAVKHFTIACRGLMDDKVDDQSRFRELCIQQRHQD